jgi:Na+-transporting methylmalonyl-CoA/oxaloacetate decarboxylase gamma subunit
MEQKEQSRKWQARITGIGVAILVILFLLLAIYGYKKLRRTEKDKQAVEKSL